MRGPHPLHNQEEKRETYRSAADRVQSQLQRLTPLPDRLLAAGLKPDPPEGSRICARDDEFEE